MPSTFRIALRAHTTFLVCPCSLFPSHFMHCDFHCLLFILSAHFTSSSYTSPSPPSAWLQFQPPSHYILCYSSSYHHDFPVETFLRLITISSKSLMHYGILHIEDMNWL